MAEVDNVSVTSEKSSRDQKRGLNSFLRIFTFTDRLGWILNTVACAAAVATGTLLPLMNYIFGKFVTTLTRFATGESTPAQFRSELVSWTLWFVYLFIAKFILTYLWTVAISLSAIRTTRSLRITFLKSVLRQDIAFFDNKLGSVSTQITNNGNLVNIGISEKLGVTIQGVSTFISAFILAFAVQWKLTLITIGVVPLIMLIGSICVKVEMSYQAKILPLYSHAGALAEEVFSTMKTIQAFWAGPHFCNQYEKSLRDAKDIGMKRSANSGVLFANNIFCIYSAMGLAFWQGIRRYASGEIPEIGSVVTVIFTIIAAASALSAIAPQIFSVATAASAAAELFQVIDRVPTIDSSSNEGERPDTIRGDIELRDLHFSYPTRPNVPVLKGLHLKVPAGKTTALVGSSGCGKSTIVGLLDRWYESSEGALFIDGHDIKDLNLRWLRSNMRVVQQEPTLFHGTIYDNVAYGLEGTSADGLPDAEKKQRVEEACVAANAHDFIMSQPQGYHTVLSERAGTLSGGQKQRIAIARSIVSQPKILLLDEATSGLDPKSERIVQKALDQVTTHRTTIIIAHRLSTIRNADNIVVMSHGNISEQGTHEQLLAHDGIYARLSNSQDLGIGLSSRKQSTHDPGLDPIETTKSRSSNTGALVTSHIGDDTDALKYSLLRCIGIFIKEQRELWLHLSIVGLCCIAGGLTFPAQAILFARIMTAFQLPLPQMIDKGDLFSLMFFVVAIANGISYFIIGWTTNVIGQNLVHDFRAGMFRDIIRQDMDYFEKPANSTGSIVSKLSTFPTQLQDLLGVNIAFILISIINLVSSSILALIVGWKLGLVVVFAAMPALVFAGYLRMRLDFKLDAATSRRFADSAALAAEAVSAIKTIASLTLEGLIMQRYQDAVADIEKTSIKAILSTMFWYSLTQSISFLAMALGFWYGGTLMSSGEYSANQFFIVFIAVIFSGDAAGQFFTYTASLINAQSAANHVLYLRGLEPKIQSWEDGHNHPDGNMGEKQKDNSTSQLSLESVTFAYPLQPQNQVIQDLSCEILPGKVTAFVGPSGSGKSTLIALIERYYDPTSGTVRFGGLDIAKLDSQSYRQHIGLVQQEPTLYSGSIRENISIGLSAATDEEIENACRQANIYDFIQSLPEGFNTLCGSKGMQLSGGQKQRIAIARALIRKPRVLLLDEATSALDTESEKIVQTALEKVSTGRTTVAIAHRLSTIKNADRIVVISAGKIAESGTHDELIAQRRIYYEMCLSQAVDI